MIRLKIITIWILISVLIIKAKEDLRKQSFSQELLYTRLRGCEEDKQLFDHIVLKAIGCMLVITEE